MYIILVYFLLETFNFRSIMLAQIQRSEFFKTELRNLVGTYLR